nr:rabenosyn-5 isoform X2 [Ciona intestinalis]|eukprot:XP_002122676.1 rabenosyn-5 isoform X2 [Ciona intestinalis]
MGTVKEGFLCPICVQDLGSFHGLQKHFESAHTAEDRAVLDQIKGLFSKAKVRLLKKDEITNHEVALSSNHSMQQHAGPVWESQDIGQTRNHTSNFKKIRDARIDRFVIESNKVLIRLDKLLCQVMKTKRKNTKEFEQTLVPWVRDVDVPYCPTCGDRFNVARRRHHCRLCGSIMCTKCSLFVQLELADQLVESLRKVPGMRKRTQSDLNLSRSASMSSSQDEEISLRCCHDCYVVLMKRKDRLEQDKNMPLLVLLYEKLQSATNGANSLAPEYEKIADSLNQGEETYELDTANELRFKLIKLYEKIDVVSKKIEVLNSEDEEFPLSPTTVRLQTSIRRASHAYLQENMLTLRSLPSFPKLEILQKNRRQEQEKKMRRQREEAERQRIEEERREMELEAQKIRNHQPQVSSMHKSSSDAVLDKGWRANTVNQNSNQFGNPFETNPLLEQINYVQQMLKQAKSENRFEEIESLNRNLRELENELKRQEIRGKKVPQKKLQNTNPFLIDTPSTNGNTNPFLMDETAKPFNKSYGNPFEETEADPVLHQISYIKNCIEKAVKAGKTDEARMLRENLEQLHLMYTNQ